MTRFAKACIAVSFVLGVGSIGKAQTVGSLRVMTFNVLTGGATYGPLSRTVGVIQTAQADVIGIQEVGGSAASIASSLGFYFHGFNSDTAIISRYPIAEIFGQGVRLQISPTQDAYVFDTHLAPYPYQPYDIRDGLITTEAQAIAAANAARGGGISGLLNQMAPALGSGSPVFLTGDFNEPSHLDWTQAAANAGLHFGKKVDWPTSEAVAHAGLLDSFRQLRPDVINDRGNTWTPGSPAPSQAANEVQDRIDFVYYSGPNVTPVSSKTLGYDANDGSTDIGIQPYPSDHRAVVTQFNLPTCSIADLSGNCHVGVEDWTQFRAGQQVNLTGLTHAQALAMGDLNGDFRNDHDDFVIFKTAFDASNGAGSFVAMVTSVPEPSTLLLVIIAAIGGSVARLRIRSGPIVRAFGA
jgi:endonuclease/exonuclease/phosphatase family metal-dependent hydrolase